MKTIILCSLILLLFACKESEETKECLTICEECDHDWSYVDEDVLPEIEVPKVENPKIIVLLYHNLVYGRTGDPYYHRDIFNFEQDLIYIRNNFKVINFDDLELIKKGEMELTQNAVIITFDDGDLSVHPLAFPLLKKYNLKATFFIVSGYVGEVAYATWEQLNEMADYINPDNEKIFTFGSHTKTHKELGLATTGEVSYDDVKVELTESKQIIEANLNTSINYLALPYGSGYDDEKILNIAKEAGYKGIRNSLKSAIHPNDLNLFSIPSQNIGNYPHRDFVTTVTGLLNQ